MEANNNNKEDSKVDDSTENVQIMSASPNPSPLPQPTVDATKNSDAAPDSPNEKAIKWENEEIVLLRKLVEQYQDSKSLVGILWSLLFVYVHSNLI